MPVIKKLFDSLIFKSACAISLGVVMGMLFSDLLYYYGGQVQASAGETISKVMAPPSENEKTLQGIARQLARESEKLSQIEPAAGQ